MLNINSRVKYTGYNHTGFTIVELLIVIVVIAILASISVVAYNGVQDRAKNTAVQSDISQVAKLVEIHNGDTGSYPSTCGLGTVYVDSNCQLTSTNRRTDWVPGLGALASNLPQNPGLADAGRNNLGGCYMYASDGTNYVISAWNSKQGGPSRENLYRRLGFRETVFSSSNGYRCNHPNIGGYASGTYNINNDYYKASYTISNITNCDETPPTGA